MEKQLLIPSSRKHENYDRKEFLLAKMMNYCGIDIFILKKSHK